MIYKGEDIDGKTEGVGDQTISEGDEGRGIPPIPVWKNSFPLSICSKEEAMLFSMTPLQKLRIRRELFLGVDIEII